MVSSLSHTQAFGGGLLTSSNQNAVDLGKKVILVGLSVQCATLFLFLFATINVHLKPQYLLYGKQDGSDLAWGLYITTAFQFIIRSIFRTVEYGSGKSAYITTNEW